ncbi:MAG: metal-dependent transcriptional regulator [Chloroflexus sp.]
MISSLSFIPSSMPKPLSPLESVCLLALADLAEDRSVVLFEQLVRCVCKVPEQVWRGLHRLERRALVHCFDQNTLRLTTTGYLIARHMQIQHRLLERFLFDVVGVPWIFVHREAIQIAPVTSPLFIERVAQLTCDAIVCPHGNVIPGRNTGVTNERPLTEAPFGQRCRLNRIAEWACYRSYLLQRLWSNELLPGCTLVRVPDPLYQWVIQVNQRPIVMSQRLAEMLYVVPD